MWFSVWGWFKSLRSERQRQRRRPIDDRADMGVEIGLDASLDSVLPPLLNFANKSQLAATPIVPLGTDLRAHHRLG